MCREPGATRCLHFMCCMDRIFFLFLYQLEVSRDMDTTVVAKRAWYKNPKILVVVLVVAVVVIALIATAVYFGVASSNPPENVLPSCTCRFGAPATCDCSSHTTVADCQGQNHCQWNTVSNSRCSCKMHYTPPNPTCDCSFRLTESDCSTQGWCHYE